MEHSESIVHLCLRQFTHCTVHELLAISSLTSAVLSGLSLSCWFERGVGTGPRSFRLFNTKATFDTVIDKIQYQSKDNSSMDAGAAAPAPVPCPLCPTPVINPGPLTRLASSAMLSNYKKKS